MTDKQRHDAAVTLTKGLVDEGKLIEAGFAAFAQMTIPEAASVGQLHSLQIAFMTGAEHLWSSLITIRDEAKEATADDMRRRDAIQAELKEWHEGE